MRKKIKPIYSALLVTVLLFQSLVQLFPMFTTVFAEAERSLRIHLETDSIDNNLSLWLWGDVTNISDDISEWPNGTVFSEENQTDYGYYLDIDILPEASEIGFQAVDENGDKYIEDKTFSIELDTEAIWISSEGNVYYEEPTEEETDEQGENEEATLRIHLETESIDNNLSLWLWGDVVTASGEISEWPDGTVFSEENQTDYGYYLDIDILSDASEIGFVVVDQDENRYIEDDVLVEIQEDIEVVWVTRNGTVHYEEPTEEETDEPGENEEATLRVHYLNEDANYADYGVWFWGVPNSPSDWPNDAIRFSNEQVGENGAYVDIPVGDNPSSLGFLILHFGEDVSQTEDLFFSSFDLQNEVFVTSENRDMAFLDPDFEIPTVEVEEDPGDGEEGEEDITISASVNRDFHYGEHALLDVEIENNSDLSIDRIRADVSGIGGSSTLSISPELNRVTLSVSHTIQPGTYTIPVSVWDENNGRYETTTEVTILPRNKAEGERDWVKKLFTSC
jgi:hypothetical protein